MYEDGIVHDILCDKLSGRHYHIELHCVPCNIKVLSHIINSLLYIRIVVVTNPILVPVLKSWFYCLKLIKCYFQ